MSEEMELARLLHEFKDELKEDLRAEMKMLLVGVRDGETSEMMFVKCESNFRK